MSTIVIQGDTSGSITVEAPSVAGTHTLTLPKATGNIATDATVGLGTKNLIINGNMQIAQRGTSATGITIGGYFVQDRWLAQQSGSGTWTQSQEADAPEGFASSMKWECTTAVPSPIANSYMFIQQKIEGYNLQQLKYGTANAESLTLSFWVKSNQIGTYQINILGLLAPATNPMISTTYTIDAANTWEKKTWVIPGYTPDSIPNDNTEGLRLEYTLNVGSDFASGTFNSSWGTFDNADRGVNQGVQLADTVSNYINITGVQLEVGENATPFEHRMYSQELAMCQRYCYKIGGDSSAYTPFSMGTSYNTVGGNALVNYPVAMRATPTMTPTYPIRSLNGGATRAVSAVSFSQGGATTAYIDYQTTTTTSGQAVMLTADGNTASNLLFSAEL